MGAERQANRRVSALRETVGEYGNFGDFGEMCGKNFDA